MTILSRVAVKTLFFALPLIIRAQSDADALARQERQEAFSKLTNKLSPDENVSAGSTDPEVIGVWETKLREIIGQFVDDNLRRRKLRDDEITSELRHLQGRSAPSSVYSNTPLAKSFYINTDRRAMIAYLISVGDSKFPRTFPHLEFYSFNGKEWAKQTEADLTDEFDTCTFFVSADDFPSSRKNEKLILVSGFQIGDSATRLKVRLYRYDGFAVQTLWKMDNLIDGDISVVKDVIQISYSARYKSSDPVDQMKAEFRVNGDKVTCITSHCGNEHIQ